MKIAEQFVSQVETNIPENQEQARASVYGLLARLLYAAPDHHLLDLIVTADDIASHAYGTALGQAWRSLQLASEVADEEALALEFEQLFIGLGQGEVVPYMSWHLTGFLMEEPLARLRDDLAELGLGRMDAVSEPEDHIAAILEVMRFLVVGGADSAVAALALQKNFFSLHLKPWYALCSAQIEAAPSANYYRLVARLLRAFLDVEAQSFEMVN